MGVQQGQGGGDAGVGWGVRVGVQQGLSEQRDPEARGCMGATKEHFQPWQRCQFPVGGQEDPQLPLQEGHWAFSQRGADCPLLPSGYSALRILGPSTARPEERGEVSALRC